MTAPAHADPVGACLAHLAEVRLDPLDLLPRRELVEKLIELELLGIPAGPERATAALRELSQALAAVEAREVKVVVFGGGTGLSTVIGGDSGHVDWIRDPFAGLKAVFPQTQAIVCVTDDGGSTGELLKDLPLIALGDLRHVLLSSMQGARLQQQYGLDGEGALQVAEKLFRLFNYRFQQRPESVEALLAAAGTGLDSLPEAMARGLGAILGRLFADPRLAKTLNRPHCLGNLLLAGAIYGHSGSEEPAARAIEAGVEELAALLGAGRQAVLPCTVTPCRLQVRYANGVMVTGEDKSSRARRRSPVDQVLVEFSAPPQLPEAVLASIAGADLIVFAPGSLYTSIVPIMQVPGLSEAVRNNRRAMKVLVANLWIQKGETDLVRDDPGRRFYVSDLITAYRRNIPGGVEGLFQQVMILGLQDIPGSILQSYAVEDKLPIYLDRGKVWQMGFSPLEARIFSEQALAGRRVKHDPHSLARALRIVWAARRQLRAPEEGELPLPAAPPSRPPLVRSDGQTANVRYAAIRACLAGLEMEAGKRIAEILWRHADIPLSHLAFIRGVRLIPAEQWRRCQEWDQVYSFFDPLDATIKIRADIGEDPRRFEVAFLVALGQSLLGDYAGEKVIRPMIRDGVQLGKVYELTLRPEAERHCLFTGPELQHYLQLTRMQPLAGTPPSLYVRLLNGSEGFTPPGLFFGLAYAWYLDNRFAAHLEYKMAITRMELSDLIPEQLKEQSRRREMIDFLREVVFGHRREAGLAS